MSQEQNKPKISQLLERLQEESWQLELLISGFAIFLVGSSYEQIEKLNLTSAVLSRGLEQNASLQIPLMILIGSWIFLLTNLIVHVVLRGFWISAIGLRYISGDIEFDKLRLSPKFDAYLKRRMPSFDMFIERLEKFCSVVFAFTFLIIFVFLSLGLFVAFLFLLRGAVDVVPETWISEHITDIIQKIVVLVMLLFGAIYFVDFITLSWVKRIKWFSKIYFPIYKLMSLVTLSFVYRPLYYNMIDNTFGRRVGFFIIPYIILILTLVSTRTVAFKYFPSKNTKLELKTQHYLDKIKENKPIVQSCIPSKYVDGSYLELFIPYSSRNDDEVKFLCPDLEPDKYLGTKFDIISFGSQPDHPSPPDSLLLCLGQLYQVSIDDSLHQSIDHMFYRHPHAGEHGLLSVVDIDYLPRGRHELVIKKVIVYKKQDSIAYKLANSYPFWKE